MPQMSTLQEQLAAKGYELHSSFSHQDLVRFIKPYMEKPNRFAIIYKGNLVLLMLLAFGGAGFLVGSGRFSFEIIKYFLLGLGLVVFLIPIHEIIHGIAYKIVGAPSVQYGVVWKQAVFYAMADRHVIGFSAFLFVALAPFVLINSLLILAIFILPAYWPFTSFSMLLFHSLFTGGDFALLSFFQEHRHLDMVTYDDRSSGMTFFYAKQN
jgi:hypothetical protein